MEQELLLDFNIKNVGLRLEMISIGVEMRNNKQAEALASVETINALRSGIAKLPFYLELQ
jgi:hypothetical protein